MPQFGPHSRRSHHPYLLKELADLPAGLRWLVEPLIAPGEAVETIFIVPEQQLDRKYEGGSGVRPIPTQAMVFTSAGAIYVQRSFQEDQAGWASAIRFEDLLYAQLTVILLFGRLELCGTANGELQKIVMQFNSVSQPMLQPALWRFLRSAWPLSGIDDAAPEPTQQCLEEIQDVSYKYRNGLHDFGLQPGERLLGFVYQPPIYRPYLGFLRRKIAPPALLAVTPRQVITIEEGLTKATSYGWMVSFYPRHRIQSIAVEPGERCREIVFHLFTGGRCYDRRVEVEADAAQRWQRLWSEPRG